MMDSAERLGLRIDTERLSQLFGSPVVPVVATKRRGLDALRAALDEALEPTAARHKRRDLPAELEADVAELVPVVAQWRPETAASQLRAFALWCLLSSGTTAFAGSRRGAEAVRRHSRGAP